MLETTQNNKHLTKLSLAIALGLSSFASSAIVINANQDANTLQQSLIIPGSGINVTGYSLFGGNQSDGGFDGEFDGEFDEELCIDEVEPCFSNDFPVEVALDLPIAFDVENFASNTLALDENFTSSQAGTYTNASGVYGLPSQGGIVLSSGFVSDYEDGENTSGSNTGGDGTSATDEQNELLSTISGRPNHFDPIELNIVFDVDEGVDTISFIAAFGSEEFPNFVNSSFTDAFGMFLNNDLVAGVLPSDAAEGGDLLPVNIDHPDFAAIEGTELNGLLAPNGVPLLRFDIPVTPGSTANTFSIIIADTSDSSFDSTVFLSSFGNFDSESGNSEFTPILPDPSNPTNDEGAFVFDLPELEENQTIWIDPDVATGYVYETDGEFSSVTAPTLLTVNDLDGFMLHFTDNTGTFSVALTAGQTFTFGAGVSTFTLDGIDPDLALDPTDSLAFTLGVAFNSNIGTFVTQNPITTFISDSTSVPEPSTIAILGLSLLGFRTLKRKK